MFFCVLSRCFVGLLLMDQAMAGQKRLQFHQTYPEGFILYCQTAGSFHPAGADYSCEFALTGSIAVLKTVLHVNKL